MPKSVFFVVESGQVDDLVSLAGRILAYSALDRPAEILFRLDGEIWLRPAAAWPVASETIRNWLNRQEFADAAMYWQMALATAKPKLFWCASGGEQAPALAEASSLTRFLLAAAEAGVEPVWL